MSTLLGPVVSVEKIRGAGGDAQQRNAMRRARTSSAPAFEVTDCASNESLGRGGHRYAPHVFTEQGVAMLSSVLRSERAAKVNVEIMR
jgi:hypothetical protein